MKSSKPKARLPAKMASRNQEICPVGAWVQPEPYYGQQYQGAVVAAQYEEAKIQRTQAAKEERLRQFQDDVKKRVIALEKVKRQQLLEKSYKAVEVERNVLNQSARAAEKSTPRKNRCLIRDDSGLGIRQSALTNSQGCVINGEIPGDSHNFESQEKQVKEIRSQARRKLVSCKVLSEAYNPDSLPGGTWREGATRDHPFARHSEYDSSTAEYAEELEDLENEVPHLETRSKVVHFDLNSDDGESRDDRITRKSVPSLRGTDVARIPSVPNIYPGVQDEEEKQLAVKQRAMYRRLFMDIEREQVKENIKRMEHRKKIQTLKKSKEEQRRLQEGESELLSAPKDPVTGETLQEMFDREREEETRILAIEQEHNRRTRKERENDRYLGALKSQLREKVVTQGLELPAICWCGPTVWDTNPDTCANNCVFYKNPKAYAKALQSLLSSCQLN